MTLDRITRWMIALLQDNGRLPNVELANRVGMSASSCLRRVRNLERDGVIKGYTAVIDGRALGLTVAAFVWVTVEKQPDARTEAFHARVREEAHIVECHAMSGAHDYLMKVVARDIDHFSALVMQGILKYPAVLHVESSFSLGEIKHSRILPA